MQEIKDTGLRGITIADTKISAVDGTLGKLIYRGYDIEHLAYYSSFEETVYLLLYEFLPTKKELNLFKEKLLSERQIPDEIILHLKNRKSAHPMDMLQSIIATFPDIDKNARLETKDANIEKSIKIISKIPLIVASWERIRKDLDVIKPDENLSHAANFLYMLNGKIPDKQIAKEFDKCLILHADHTFNASTFTGRVVASTRAHIYACVSAAIGALSGELHGGANEKVMGMLLEIGDIDNVEKYIISKLDAGERIMGMGHAVYNTYDPRAKVLSKICGELAKRTKNTKWYELAQKIEHVTQNEFKKRKDKDIYPNVDFYSAPVYYSMGIDSHLFTPIFVISRVAGWCSHVVEERFAQAQPKPVIYRPNADYVGKYCGPQGCEYIPLEKRENILK